MPPASVLSYPAATALGAPRGPRPMARVRSFYPARPTGPAWRRRPISGFGDMGTRLIVPLAGLGQAGSTVDLPDGSSHTVQSVNTSGEILTADGWQSATQTDGTERWVNVHTGDVMLSTGETLRAARAVPTWLWWGGAGVLGLGVLGFLLTPRPRRRRR